MKTVTLKEFAELVKNDEQLQGRIKDAVVKREEPLTSEFSRIVAEAGYELKKEEPLDMEALDDDDLENVAGGVHGHYGLELCYLMAKLLGYDPDLCV
jgi:predicted ribosomally synthesized peptide with nif11-like leader